MTSEPGSDKTDAMLEALRARYRAGLGTTLATLELLSTQIETAPDAGVVLESLRREMHRLHGSAGTYGFAHASHLAGALEARLAAWRADPAAEAAERSGIVGNFIRAFRSSVFGDENAPGAGAPSILMVGLAPGMAAALEAEAGLRGFAVKSIDKNAVTPQAIADVAPRVVIAAASLVKRLPNDLSVPIIAVASKARTLAPERSSEAAAIVVDAKEPAGALLDLIQELTARADVGGETLLVVDDDPSILVIVRALAEHDGMRVVTLDSPSGLQDAIDREHPAMLLMDVQMGDLDGIGATRTLRGQPRNRDLPILLFSGSMGMATREAAFRAGADDFFAKPIVPQELRQRLQVRLEQRRLRRIAEGMHGALDITLAARTARDAAEAWSTPGEISVAVIHPDPGFDDAAWLAEVRRIVALVSRNSRALGFHDGDALLAVIDASGSDAVQRLEALRASRPASAPGWHAGVAAHADAGTAFEQGRRAALEALDVARRSGARGVHQWTRADDAVAPDVIVVEDDVALSDMLQYALRSGGYTYRAFSDGNSAYQELIALRTGSRRPIVLLDVDLPGMDGHSLHERLRAERPGAFVVVFLSVHSGEGDQVRALHAGAWDYLTKPLNLRVLMAKLPIWLTRAAAEP